jgi:prevent-host-death family protein
MTETISARDANHHFSRVLREVEGGKEFVVTRDGVPVARIVPEAAPISDTRPNGRRALTGTQKAALARTIERLTNPAWGPIERVSRQELYDEARPWMAKLK